MKYIKRLYFPEVLGVVLLIAFTILSLTTYGQSKQDVKASLLKDDIPLGVEEEKSLNELITAIQNYSKTETALNSEKEKVDAQIANIKAQEQLIQAAIRERLLRFKVKHKLDLDGYDIVNVGTEAAPTYAMRKNSKDANGANENKDKNSKELDPKQDKDKEKTKEQTNAELKN